MTVVSIHDLTFSYSTVPIIEKATLDIYQKDSVCIVGPNGGGKTTLVRLMLGMLKPQHGSVTLFGRSPADSLLRVGYVPQYVRFDPQFPVTVLDVVLMGRLGTHRGSFYTKKDREIAGNALSELHLTDLAQKPFAQLSGGQRQRVIIARALATEPEILILDEPTANIDAAAEANLFEMLTSFNRHLTIIVVTHDLGFVSQFFRRVICVNRQVVIHPTSAITGELIQDIYGGDIRMVRHDHRCAEGGHLHD